MTPSRPYLLRAFYEWIIDNDFTPYIVVDATLPGVDVPSQYIENGRIILNVAPEAILNLSLENDHIAFHARFNGIPHDIYAPIRSITAIYAKENGRGMVFKEEEDDQPPPVAQGTGGPGISRNRKGSAKSEKRAGRPNLTVVK